MTELDPRVTSAAEHVQRAALELIAALRDALDLAEDLVGDPRALLTTFDEFVTPVRDELVKSRGRQADSLQRISLDD